jgi:hypothetical protein
MISRLASRYALPRTTILQVPRYRFCQGKQLADELVRENKQKMVGGWLFLCAAGVLGMIVLGGYTRLTHSGLSMADWSPYTKKYPRTDEEW